MIRKLWLVCWSTGPVSLWAIGIAGRSATTDEFLPYAGVVDTDPRTLAAFLDDTIGPVGGYDRQRGTELPATLRAFVRCNASPTRTARMLRSGQFARFSASLDADIVSSGTWQGSDVTVGSTHAEADDGKHATGAFLTFAAGAEVTAKIGLCYLSVAVAAANADAEATDLTFDQAREQAADAWRQALGTVEITGGTDAARTRLYTALYHALLHPNIYDDVIGKYFGHVGTVCTAEPVRARPADSCGRTNSSHHHRRTRRCSRWPARE